MLSILIPIYNFNVVQLVSELHHQSVECGIPFEILCLDDASDSFFKAQNREISSIPSVIYKELESNIGRSKIRNKLAEDSDYDNLLFLDCDSALPSRDFIKKYVIHIENYHVVYGGRIYESNPPLAKEKFFRWIYGKKRESISVDSRLSSPYKSFMTNNFLIHKKAFLSIRLNEHIVGYGHEDTMFGIRLKENSVAIKHINNPVVHVGLEDFDEYIEKTVEGLRNLIFIAKFVDLNDTVRLYRFLTMAKKYRIENLISNFEHRIERHLLRNLEGSTPILKGFDLFKIGRLIRIEREHLQKLK
ncbi:MAG: glycosyltransferase [Vicingaceae bacterium]